MSIIETNIWYMCILTSMCWIYCYGWLKVDKVHPRGALQMAREDSFFCIPRVLHSKECTLTLNVPYIGSKWYILERWMRSCNHNYVRSILYGNRWHIHIYKGLHVVPMGTKCRTLIFRYLWEEEREGIKEQEWIVILDYICDQIVYKKLVIVFPLVGCNINTY